MVARTNLITSKPAGAHEVYAARRFEAGDTWRFGDKRFKLLLISHFVDRPPFASEPLEAARAFVETLVPEMDVQGGHFDLGYVVLHQGQAANWLLFDWWIEGGITCQILCRSTLAHPTVFGRVDRPFMACVWEALAISHERDAWVETMMQSCPDPEAYLRRRIASGER